MNSKSILRTAGDYALNLVPVVGALKYVLNGRANPSKVFVHYVYNAAVFVYLAQAIDTRELNPLKQIEIMNKNHEKRAERASRLDKIMDTDGDGSISMQERFDAWQNVDGRVRFLPLTERQEDALLKSKK
jgi:hypothetical protein